MCEGQMKGSLMMNYSAAKWLVIILGSASILAIFTYFYLDENDMMTPWLSTMIVPFLTITMLPVVFLLAAMLFANNKQEKQISKQTFKRAGILIATLLFFKFLTGYLSR